MIKKKNKWRERGYLKKYRQTERGRLNKTKSRLKREGREKLIKDTLTSAQIKEIKEKYKSCVYCGSRDKLTFEHIIPIAKMGKIVFIT